MSTKSYGPNENGSFTMADLERMPGFKRSGDRIRCACPIHRSDNPQSFSVDLTTGRGRCWSHGCWGYLDDGRERGDRDHRLAYGSAPTIPTPAPAPPPDAERVALLRRTWPRLMAAFPDSPAAAYLQARGIAPEVARAARIGYDAEGTLWQAIRGRVVFPLATIAGVPINVAARRLTMPGQEDKDGRWLYLPGNRGYFNPAGIRAARDELRTLYICEGAGDALALLAGGLHTSTAIGGSGGVVRAEDLRGVYRVVLCFDADQTGQQKGPALGWLAAAAGCQVLQLTADELEGSKDIAEYWQTRGALPPALVALAAEEVTTLDDEVLTNEAGGYSVAEIAARVERLRARWQAGARDPQARGVLADWEAIAARRAALDAAREAGA